LPVGHRCRFLLAGTIPKPNNGFLTARTRRDRSEHGGAFHVKQEEEVPSSLHHWRMRSHALPHSIVDEHQRGSRKQEHDWDDPFPECWQWHALIADLHLCRLGPIALNAACTIYGNPTDAPVLATERLAAFCAGATCPPMAPEASRRFNDGSCGLLGHAGHSNPAMDLLKSRQGV
jgi:hypothetical protein